MSSANLVESAKKAAAYRAVDEHLDSSYRYVGIGSGSTVVYVVDAIAAKGPDFYKNMIFFPTGSQSKALIRNAGLALSSLPDRPLGPDGIPVALDVAFDGADEVDAELNCIKGGGACLLQEKGVAIRAKKFVVVADYRKLSDRLCTKWTAGIPIEVDPFFATDVLADLQALGAIAPKIRLGLPAKAGECVTDNGNWIIDAPFKPLKLRRDPPGDGAGQLIDHEWEVSELAAALKGLVGVVETGLFWGLNGVEAERSNIRRATPQKPVAAYFGMENGEVEVRNAS
ncbi:related to D-ribose-5-phosphate ketol-isomerase [Cephalotrichum gorgonifer]|uniref:Ribose-5-phosphate isomerase n=1 Tax=Cephalotrichum gorgonifer TaxID=2041049 RepID=A0AAE8SWP2_9PEZI|nr:related to D-ribose-5-phosphate ketol-isomerase [Cephalotrichum gorgonifer]